MIVHSYMQTPGGMGLGDFLRGSLALHQLCANERTQLMITFKNHPVGKYIVSPHVLDLETHDLNNQCVHLHELRRRLNEMCGRRRIRGVNLALLCNTFPRFPISNSTKEFLKSALIPTAELNERIKETISDTNFEVIHIRVGDLLAYNTTVNYTVQYDRHEMISKLCRYIDRIKENNMNHLILMCDSDAVKDELGRKCNIQTSDAKSVHLNVATDKDDACILDTLVDFFMLTRAKAIHQYSVHGWGSTFSNAAHWIYDVPLYSYRLLE